VSVVFLSMCLNYTSSILLLCDARSAKHGIAIVSRPSVCLSVRPSVTLWYHGVLVELVRN